MDTVIMARYFKLRVFVLCYKEAYCFLNDPATLTGNLRGNGNNCKCKKKNLKRNIPNNLKTPKNTHTENTHGIRISLSTLQIHHLTSELKQAQNSNHIQACRIKCKITIPLCRDDAVWLN